MFKITNNANSEEDWLLLELRNQNLLLHSPFCVHQQTIRLHLPSCPIILSYLVDSVCSQILTG